ncbi:NifU family protein [Planctomycetota bacterium]|nr:NifU family protein [Planctomycetota bacterium]
MSQQAPENASDNARSVHDQVEEIIERIRPAIQLDGGDVELVRITDDNVVLVRLHGACIGCPSANMTLQMGIERNVREKVPEIVGVEQVP